MAAKKSAAAPRSTTAGKASKDRDPARKADPRRSKAKATTPTPPAKGEQAPAILTRFWGVRGSIATPGEKTLKTGGNTSCVEVRCGGHLIIFDMGTGLKPLGQSLLKEGPGVVKANIFVSHYHWDHIVGLPFFGPAYDPRSELTIHGATRKGRDVRQILAGQMIDPYFPVDLGVFNARLRFVPLQDGGQVKLGDVRVRAFELNHPGGALGYRVEHQGKAVVYATDFEHGTDADDRLVEMAKGADLMIFDSQYTPAEYEAPAPFSKKGWGHSTYEMGATLARLAGVQQLALYHHEPERNDDGIEALAVLARKIHPGAFAAREGLTIEV